MESNNLSAREVCQLIGVSRPTLSRLCAAGKIGFYRVGVRLLFSPEHVKAFLESCEVKPREVAPRHRAQAA